MPHNPIQKSKLENKPAPNNRTNKRSWLQSKLRFKLPKHNQKEPPEPQRKSIEASRHEVAASRSNLSAESRKTSSQNPRSPEKEPDLVAYMARGGYLDSPQVEPIRSREPFAIELPQKFRQSYSQTQDPQDQPSPPSALTFSKEQANYYDNLSPEMCKTYGYPLPAKSSEFKIPRKPLEKYEYRLDENIEVGIGKKINFIRPQIKDIPPQANYPKPPLGAKTCSSRSRICPRSPRIPSTMNSEELKREFSDFENFRPRKEYQKLQQTVKETKHAQPQTVTAGDLQRHKSIAGVIHQESSRRSSMQFSEPSHSGPGSSRIHSPAEQLLAQQELDLGVLANEYDRLDAYDRQIEEHQRESARSRKSRVATTPQPPRRTRQVESRPLPPIPPPHQSPAISVHSSARSHRPPIPTIPKPSENISESETKFLKRIPITNSSHQPAAIPIHYSARSHRTRAPNIRRTSENIHRLETEFPQRIPISHPPPPIPHQPPATPRHSSSRSRRPPTPLIPKPPEKTIHFEARPLRPVPNTLKKQRERPQKPSQPRSDRAKPHPSGQSSGKEKEKKRR
ncbi:uncharacterized protein EAF01_010443 [Botrytis porri]|uniref:uncharacterized protein n=1 Tax=Botrytis porri TaxID=87229 RepID=UPI00190132FE|nr:uncharacterized protein EAF01_010443 [Botrytis porri]KAF7892363.1 hypothetical protein EAF01_010443 [Botrytis porri]